VIFKKTSKNLSISTREKEIERTGTFKAQGVCACVHVRVSWLKASQAAFKKSKEKKSSTEKKQKQEKRIVIKTSKPHTEP
jgi:hypothetical protein